MSFLSLILFWCGMVYIKSVTGANFGRSRFGIAPRIVGGYDASIISLPYQVSLRIFGEHLCGGSIIRADAILTAAHCVNELSASYLQVQAGSVSLTKGGSFCDIQEIIVHPNYRVEQKVENDIAILMLKESLKFGPGIHKINLPKSRTVLQPGTLAIVSGWGKLYTDGPDPISLQAVTVPIVARDECKLVYGASRIDDSSICAGYKEGGRDACQDDSGGPLAVNDILYGVVSWGHGCALPGMPGVYTSVAFERKWIDAVLSKKN